REPNMTPHVAKNGRLSVTAYLEDYAWLGYRGLFPGHRMLRQTIMHSLSTFIESLRTGSCFKPGYAEACENLRLLARAAGVADIILMERMIRSARTGAKAIARPVAMIGIDAADLDFIQANISSLPNLRRALDTGITRKL